MAPPPGGGRTSPPVSLRRTGQDRRTFKIQLRQIDSTKPVDRQTVLKTTFTELNAPLIRLTPISTGYYAITDNEQTIDKLLTSNAANKLKKINLTAVIPPELKSKRTIFARQLDSHAGQHSPEEIQAELEKNHPYMKGVQTIKIKDYTHVIKLILPDTSIANKILESGFNLFNTRVTPQQIEPEKFTHLLICYKCYKIEDHPTKDCPSNTIICSECSEIGHTFRNCSNPTKACINCPAPHNNHRTLAAKCPYRKRKIEQKEQQQKDQEDNQQRETFAKIAKQAVKETKATAPPQPIIQMTDKMHIKIVALILEAHIASLTGNGTYSQTLSDSLKANFDIDLKIPDRDSAKALNLLLDPHTKTDLANFLSSHESMDEDHSSDQSSDNDDPITSIETGTRPKQRHRSSPKQTSSDHHSTKRKASPTEHNKSKKLAIQNPQEQIPSERETVKQLTITPESFNLSLYRSAEDQIIYPSNPTPEFYWNELHKKEFGLKIEITSGNIHNVLHYIKEGYLKITPRIIKILPHDEFISIAKVKAPRNRHSSNNT